MEIECKQQQRKKFFASNKQIQFRVLIGGEIKVWNLLHRLTIVDYPCKCSRHFKFNLKLVRLHSIQRTALKKSFDQSEKMFIWKKCARAELITSHLRLKLRREIRNLFTFRHVAPLVGSECVTRARYAANLNQIFATQTILSFISALAAAIRNGEFYISSRLQSDTFFTRNGFPCNASEIADEKEALNQGKSDRKQPNHGCPISQL